MPLLRPGSLIVVTREVVYADHEQPKGQLYHPSRKRAGLLKSRDIMLHLGEFLEEARPHGPILEVVGVLEEDPGYLVAIVLGIKGKDVSV